MERTSGGKKRRRKGLQADRVAEGNVGRKKDIGRDGWQEEGNEHGNDSRWKEGQEEMIEGGKKAWRTGQGWKE